MDSKLENRIDEIFKDVPKTEKMVLTISKLKEKANSKFIEIREQGFSRTVAYNEVDDWIMKAKIIIDEEVAKLNETEQAPLKKTSPSSDNASVMTEQVNVKVSDRPAIIVENIDMPIDDSADAPAPEFELKVAKAPVAPKAISYDNLKVASASVVTLPPHSIEDTAQKTKSETAVKEQKSEKQKSEEIVQKPKAEKPKKVSADVSDFDLDDILGKPKKKKKDKPEKEVKAKVEKPEKAKKEKIEKPEKIKKEKTEKVKKEKAVKTEPEVLSVSESEQAETKVASETEQVKDISLPETEDISTPETKQAEVKDISLPETEDISTPETKQAEVKDFSVINEETALPEFEHNTEIPTADSNFESNIPVFNNDNTETEQFKGNKILGITYFVLGGAVAVVAILKLLGVF